MNLLELPVFSLGSKKVFGSQTIFWTGTKNPLSDFFIFPRYLLVLQEVRSCAWAETFQCMRFFLTQWHFQRLLRCFLVRNVTKSVYYFTVFLVNGLVFLPFNELSMGRFFMQKFTHFNVSLLVEGVYVGFHLLQIFLMSFITVTEVNNLGDFIKPRLFHLFNYNSYNL